MPSQFKASGYVPPVMQPLVDAAEKGLDLEPAIREITHRLGFESFMYGICLDPLPSTDARQLVFTTLPYEWVRRYEAFRYIDLDPRVRQITQGTLPIIWDQKTYKGRSRALDRFLDDSKAHGIGSGVSLAVRDAHRRPTVMALNSSMPINKASRIDWLSERLGDIMLLSQYIHELVMLPALERSLGPSPPCPHLTKREKECLVLGAHGLASPDISRCMSITVRTVQMHFDSVRLKLGAANRQEAVALAIKRGIIVV